MFSRDPAKESGIIYPYFYFFGKQVGSYALCAIIGIIAAFIASYLISKSRKLGFSFDDLLLMFVVMFVGLIAGGHLMFAVTNIGRLAKLFSYIGRISASNFLLALADCFGGNVFYGGFLGGLLALTLYLRLSEFKDHRRGADLYATVTPLFHAFGRIGCFLGGCCYGVESTVGFTVTNNSLSPEINGVKRFPISLVEAAINLVIFLIILRLSCKKEGRRSFSAIGVYLTLYPVARFVIEFFRGDVVRGFFLGLSTSQWISIILFPIGVFLLAKSHLQSKSEDVT